MIYDSKKIIYLIVFVSLAIGFSLNEYNLHVIRQNNPANILINAKATLYNETVWSGDNEFYISPPENYLKGKGWRRDPPVGNGSYFRRVPGYSVFYFFFRILFNVPLALKLLKFAQMLLFALSVIYIYKILKLLKFSNVLVAGITFLYGAVPFFSCFAYYTSTESVSPYLAVFYFYFLLKAFYAGDKKLKWNYYLIASLFIGVSILTRPPMALLALSLPLFIYKDYYKEKGFFYFAKKSFLLTATPLLLISAWALRNYLLTKEFVPLEQAYHPQTLDRMKPEFEGILALTKCWGEATVGPKDFNSYYIPFQDSVLVNGDTSNVYIENILKAWPVQIINDIGQERLAAVLKEHQRALYLQKPYYDKNIAMPSDYFPLQLKVQSDYHILVSEFTKKHLLTYWLKTPFHYFKNMVFHSNTSQLFIFQKEVLGHQFLFVCKCFLFLLNILLYGVMFCNLFLIKDRILKYLFAVTPLVMLLFFCLIFRQIEQRYMLPVLPLMVIGLAFPINYFIAKRPSR